jgi:hypothetical protein
VRNNDESAVQFAHDMVQKLYGPEIEIVGRFIEKRSSGLCVLSNRQANAARNSSPALNSLTFRCTSSAANRNLARPFSNFAVASCR